MGDDKRTCVIPAPRRGKAPGALRPGRRPGCGRASSAFTLIEILIVVVILGIIAAVVVPQFSNASQVARENTLKDELRYLRTQLVVYKAQHNDIAPGYPPGNSKGSPAESYFKDQMTLYTNQRGNTNPASSSTYPLGPYLQKIPANPLTTATGVKIIANGSPMPKGGQYAGDGKQYGWIYKPETQELIANTDLRDNAGRFYMDY
ncbi:MAG TPA: type II secretion system protein [Tepidisphaeraceae bacterium]|jgi:general secretion pathway protein G